MSNGLIGSTNISYAGTSSGTSSAASGSTTTTIPFSVLLDANGRGTRTIANADTKKVGGLSFNGIPSLSYASPYRDDLDNETDIVIQVADFLSSDAGLEVTGFYWTE